MTVKTKSYEFAQHVETKENIREYLMTFLEEDGAQGFIDALEHLARKKRMTEEVRG